MPPKRPAKIPLPLYLSFRTHEAVGHPYGTRTCDNCRMYVIRRLKIERGPELDDLSMIAGAIYSRTLICFWRSVRKGVWLSSFSMMRWHTDRRLHAHSADAMVQQFFNALNSWRARRRTDGAARPPRRRRRFVPIQWKSSAIRLRKGKLILSNGRITPPLVIPWPFRCPRFVEIGWTGSAYELRAVYHVDAIAKPIGDRTAGVDLGEIHLAAAHDGTSSIILNGRYLRSTRRYQNKLKARLSGLLAKKKRASRRWKKLQRSKNRQLTRLRNQIDDVLHKQTYRFVSTLHERGVQTIAVGDVRHIRRRTNCGRKANQQLHQWCAGKLRKTITYKAQRLGMQVVLVDERYTSQSCPACGRCHKPQGREYRCRFCLRTYHRDLVGAYNIRAKYRGNWSFPVVGVHPSPCDGMASPTGMRYYPHSRRSSP